MPTYLSGQASPLELDPVAPETVSDWLLKFQEPSQEYLEAGETLLEIIRVESDQQLVIGDGVKTHEGETPPAPVRVGGNLNILVWAFLDPETHRLGEKYRFTVVFRTSSNRVDARSFLVPARRR